MIFCKLLFCVKQRTASSTCRLYVLILSWSFSTISRELSRTLWSSSPWKAISFSRLSCFRTSFWVSPCLRCSESSSTSSSRTRCSSFWMIFFPPLRDDASASSNRASSSLIWASWVRLTFSIWLEWSCSRWSSSDKWATSVADFFDCSSAAFSAFACSSKSLYILKKDEFWIMNSIYVSVKQKNWSSVF